MLELRIGHNSDAKKLCHALDGTEMLTLDDRQLMLKGVEMADQESWHFEIVKLGDRIFLRICLSYGDPNPHTNGKQTKIDWSATREWSTEPAIGEIADQIECFIQIIGTEHFFNWIASLETPAA